MENINKYQKEINQLSNSLWNMANELRGTMDANEFKNYILGMMFYKFLSDKTLNFVKKLLEEEKISYQEAWKDEEIKMSLTEDMINELGYVLEPKYLVSEMMDLIGKQQFSIDYLESAIKDIVSSTINEKSEDIFKNLFDDMDLKSTKLGKTIKERSELISGILKHLDNLELDFDNREFDILGSAYIELIALFGMSAGKKGGEFFSPQGTVKLCSKLATVGLTTIKNAGDMACGSGSMLLELGEHCKVYNYYGQEKNTSTANLAKMNMLLHGIDYANFHISNVDTLTEDPFQQVKYDVQVANPPYSIKWKHTSELEQDERYSSYGKLAPQSAADFAFLQHMIYHMSDDGRIAVLLPHGVLFRGAAEEQIRKYIIENQNYLDAVIGLPAGMFSTTGIPVVCLVLKKNRNGNSNNICFIDASKNFTKQKTINILTDEDIERIVNAYTERKEIEKFCHIATLEEVRENGYNLNIPRYVDTFEEEEEIDLNAVMKEYKEIEKQEEEVTKELNKFLKELGLEEL